MRIFYTKSGYGSEKVNFVDENNAFVGYDTAQSCCESADWFLANHPTERTETQTDPTTDFPGWVFDPSYFKEVSHARYSSSDGVLADSSYNALDAGGMVIFRLVNGDQEMFLHLYNCHNGYYGHGFEFSIGDQGIREGVL